MDGWPTNLELEGFAIRQGKWGETFSSFHASMLGKCVSYTQQQSPWLSCVPLSREQPNAADGPTFEVATIKPAAPPQTFGGDRVMFRFGRTGGPGTADPGRITWNNASLMEILIEAWDVKRFR